MEQTDLQKIAESEGIDPEVKEVYLTLDEFKNHSARASWITRRNEAWKGAIENDMLDGKSKEEIKDQGQEPTSFNRCNKGIQGASAMVTAQRPEAKYKPVGGTDLYISEILKRGHDYTWDKNEADNTVYDAVEESNIGGIGFISAHHNPSKGLFGAIEIDEEPPDDMYWSADSRKRDLSDTHIIKAKLRTKKYIKDHYEGISDADLFYSKETKDEGSKSSGVTTGDNYAEGSSDKADGTGGGGLKGPKNIWELEAWMLQMQKQDWIIDDPEGPTPMPRQMKPEEIEAGETAEQAAERLKGKHWRRIREVRAFRIIVGKKLIPQKDEDGNEVNELINPHGEDSDGNPIMGLIAIRKQRTRTSYPMSPTMYALPINRDKIKKRLLFMLHLAHNVNAPIIEPAQGIEWVSNTPTGKGSPGTPGTRAKVSQNIPFKPFRLAPGAVQAQLFVEAEAKDDRDIDDQYDWPEVLQGKVPQRNKDISGRGVIALQEGAQTSTAPAQRTVEGGLERLAKIITALQLRHWHRSMWERLIEPDELITWMPDAEKAKLEAAAYGQDESLPEEEQKKIKLRWTHALEKISPTTGESKEDAIAILGLDVKITAGSSMPTNRMAKEVVAFERMKVDAFDAEAYLEYVDDPNKDKTIARMRQKEKALMEAEMAKGVK